MKSIQILGTGCPKCKKLAEAAETAAKELGIEYEIEKITEIVVRIGELVDRASERGALARIDQRRHDGIDPVRRQPESGSSQHVCQLREGADIE